MIFSAILSLGVYFDSGGNLGLKGYVGVISFALMSLVGLFIYILTSVKIKSINKAVQQTNQPDGKYGCAKLKSKI